MLKVKKSTRKTRSSWASSLSSSFFDFFVYVVRRKKLLVKGCVIAHLMLRWKSCWKITAQAQNNKFTQRLNSQVFSHMVKLAGFKMMKFILGIILLSVVNSSKSELARHVVLNSGRSMPLLGFGTFHWQGRPDEMKAAVYEALKVGYRHFDCASLYRNERQVGEALALGMKDFNISRDELFITSKLWNTHHNPEDVEPAFRKSLKDLAVDYLDLYLIHWPVAFEPGNIPFPHDQDGKIKVANHHHKSGRNVSNFH